VNFDNAGLAATTLTGLAAGTTYITVMAPGDLYDSKQITVDKAAADKSL
jgi:hypothetical protein